MALNLKIQPLKLKGIIIITFLCLLFGHLVIKAFFPNPIFWIIGFIILFAILSFILIKRKDEFSFILIIYICSHFSYADNQGGLWNLLSFALLFTYLIFVKKRTKFLFIGNSFINILILIFIIWNFIGLIFNNPLPFMSKFQLGLTFIAYILIFFFVSNQKLSPRHLKHFVVISAVIVIYMFIVALNQRYLFINLDIPVLPLKGSTEISIKGEIVSFGYATTNANSTLANCELFGEYSVLCIALILPIIISKKTQINLNLKKIYPVIIFTFSFLNLFLSGSRSSVILTLFVLAIYFLFFSLSQKIPKLFFAFSGTIVLVFLLLLFFRNYIGFDTTLKDFNKIEIQNLSFKNIISGESINRGLITEMAVNRIKNHSWFFGYGYGNFESNKLAWFGITDDIYAGVHNLYLSLPMIYGWIGSISFLLIIIFIFAKTISTYRKYKSLNHYLIPFLVGFIILWFIFLIDEYKISMLRNPNYYMMFWIWLGLTNALTKNIKKEVYAKVYNKKLTTK